MVLLIPSTAKEAASSSWSSMFRFFVFLFLLSSQGFTQLLLLLFLLLLLLYRSLSRVYSVSSSTTVPMIPAKWAQRNSIHLFFCHRNKHYSWSHIIPFPSLVLNPHLIKHFRVSRALARAHTRILLSRLSLSLSTPSRALFAPSRPPPLSSQCSVNSSTTETQKP
jgi:hypothetical protein